MILGSNIEQVNTVSGTRMTTLLIFIFILCHLIHIFTSFSFLEHYSIMILGRIIEQVNMDSWSVAYKNDNSAYLHLLILSPDPYSSFSFPEHNSLTIRNILMILGRIIKQVTRSVGYKNDNSAYLHFLIMSPAPNFLLHFSF